MSLIQNNNPEFQDASPLYSAGQPLYVGNFVMDRQLARAAPIQLDEVYTPAIDTLQANMQKAQAFAQTYGKLSVMVALNDAATSFTLEYPDKPIAQTAPIQTTRKYLPSEFFTATDRDAPYTYLLCNEQAMTAELALIQALHMLDYAIVSDQFDGNLPLVKTMSLDQLVELQAKNPEAFIRTYGNVRGVSDAPSVLGTVIPTEILEKSGVEFTDINTGAQPPKLQIVPEALERTPAAAIGITTAKRPHIGHGFLFIKALAEAGENGTVVLELNDQGPRVARAVSTLALQTGLSVEQVIDDIVDAEVTPSTLEAAYRARGDIQEAYLPSDFALTANNAFYTRLFEMLCPDTNTLVPIANSSPLMQKLTKNLLGNPATQGLFGDDGMVLLGNEVSAVIRKGGKPTLAGIIGALASGYELKMVDSPSPIDRPAQKSFAEANIAIELKDGIGISLDFGVASGSGGEVPSLQSIMSLAPSEEPEKVVYLLRALLNNSAFVRGDGKSLNPNFASVSALQKKLDELSAKDLSGVDPYKPFEFTNITRDVCRSLTPYIGEDALPAKGKVNPEEIRRLLGFLPAIKSRLSENALKFAEGNTATTSNPRKSLQQTDINLINKVRSSDPKTILPLALRSMEIEPDFARVTFRVTQLGGIMERMGYVRDDTKTFVEKLIQSGDVYVLK